MQLNVYMDREFADELAEAAARYTKRTGRFSTRQDMLKLAWNLSYLSKVGGRGLQGTVTTRRELAIEEKLAREAKKGGK